MGSEPMPLDPLPSLALDLASEVLAQLLVAHADSRRPNTSQRGYGTSHQQARRLLEPHVRSGAATCARCGEPIEPGTPWDLGHDDLDRSRYTGPEHRRCNRATVSRQAPKRYLGNWSRRWYDDPAPGTTVTLGDGMVETYLGHGLWQRMPPR
jgi:hypothetical protein